MHFFTRLGLAVVAAGVVAVGLSGCFEDIGTNPGGGTIPGGGTTPGGGGGASASGTFEDIRDGQTYKWVKIGSQVWMAENLNFETESGSWCYDNEDYYCGMYGRLYDWATAMDEDAFVNSHVWGGSDVKHRGVCPAGWHLPSRAEWSTLATFAGGKAGTMLKAKSGWSEGNGTDNYGFSALPGGARYNGGGFSFANQIGHWWTATENGSGNAYFRAIGPFYGNDNVGEGGHDKNAAFSVRCVRNN
jgi:uncharacterized protein (TIGR02145 family)